MGSILSKATKTESNIGIKRPRSEIEEEQPTNTNTKTISTISTTTTTTVKKRYKTAKDRKEHFEKTRARKNDTEEKEKKVEQTRPVNTNPNKEPRHPKRKVALLIGFCGTGYQGMQFNPGATTIESVLFEALVKANAISKDNSDDPKKVHWVRTARTDKGVHAAGNVVSAKLQFPQSDQDMLSAINQQLPDQIRVFGFVDVMRSFHAKNSCDSRVYEYLLPSYAFSAPVAKMLMDEPTSDSDMKIMSNDGSVIKYVTRSTDEEIKEKESYRISADQLETFKEALQKYIGTHNFHNYTVGRSAVDNSCKRYIIDIKVADPLYIDNVEWISVKLHGQSFMLHQIRKMISMAVLVVRSRTPLSLIEESFEPTKINIPKAPALGLLLEKPVFNSYNNRIQQGKVNQKAHQPIDFDIHKDTIDNFKKSFIYSKVFEAEREERGFDTFLTSVDNSFTDDFKYLNPEGTIPEECIVTTRHTKEND
ncbi:tRNA:pseudouridine synthase, introduces pseudouridines at positions 26-28, 34-36, 65, and 67 of tRNA [Halteromyces radiatus]|uniref:tRNA:pseudouridine synthase, introduces pseudouridines at positions 26-28, 34-36, 65, and 67 of tRNA n=1 Tax=Halteromyces radiatus TaxID=101107 RepID=UPI00221F76F5|nr:tRNA:pseudouridine synthase, introduces pseudouridines at positions 26-28, 34-36, 65, and 67 of tRNA [Halteromyces radiatus]KAI8081436.1 tRNA:pseudouridine synthase, introduces pseudouridines at positions 26-28, 34-36, 65, and 67 of tRNA [Halteromyces radiatus]